MEAIEELESMNAQFMHDPRPLDEIIAALKPLAKRACSHVGCHQNATRSHISGNYCSEHLPKSGPLPYA